MSNKPIYLTDEEIIKLLKWETLVSAVEGAMGDVSRNEVDQPARLFMRVSSKEGVLLAMPAFTKTQNALGCKIATAYKNNEQKGLPSILALILLMDADTGKVKVIMEGIEITTWRTAAASIVATKHLHRGKKKILAVLGAGTQGRIHAIGMKHYFSFDEVRIWNHRPEKARKLCKELGPWCIPYESNEDCVKGADVIVTATYAPSPVVMLDWVKAGAHINAIGVGINHHCEVEEQLYKKNGTSVYTDSMTSAATELKGLLEIGVQLTEVGKVINKQSTVPLGTKITVFQSLGMAVEDVVVSKLVYETYLKSKGIRDC